MIARLHQIRSLLRLAAALETTPERLGGAGIDRPPVASRPPLLDGLDEAESVRRLEGGGVGRIVFVGEEGPTALPVSFALLDGDVVFRTSEQGAIARALEPEGVSVGFEVDHIDDAMSEGWSVLITGRAQLVDDPAQLKQLAELGIEPWPGGHRGTVIRVAAETISGRAIQQQDSN